MSSTSNDISKPTCTDDDSVHDKQQTNATATSNVIKTISLDESCQSLLLGQPDYGIIHYVRYYQYMSSIMSDIIRIMFL